MKVQNNRMKEKTGEGMEALVKGKAYGFAYSEGKENSTYPAAETATLKQGLWYAVIYSRKRKL